MADGPAARAEVYSRERGLPVRASANCQRVRGLVLEERGLPEESAPALACVQDKAAPGSVNCQRVGLAQDGRELDLAEADLARAFDLARVAQGSANCRRAKPLGAARWRGQLEEARHCCPEWAIARVMMGCGQASGPIGHPNNDVMICKIAWVRTAIDNRTGKTAATTLPTTVKIGSTIARIGTTTGRIATRISTIAMMIGITAVGTTMAIGGATCGRITRR